jgi:hypothetical protein
VVVVSIVEGAGEPLNAADRGDEEVGEVPHLLAEVCHQPGVRHPVQDQVVLAIAQPISARPFAGVIEPVEIGDALPGVVELDQLGVRSSYRRGGSDLTFEAAEEVEEVLNLLRRVGGHPAAALRHDLDDPGGLEPAHGVHDRLLAHPELRLHVLDRDPGADRVAAGQEPRLELVQDQLGQPLTGVGGRRGGWHRSTPLPLLAASCRVSARLVARNLNLACHIEGTSIKS